MQKAKIALYWCSSCGGCEESVVDLAEDILKVVGSADIVFWPVALDFKYDDLRSMPDKSIKASLINGAIRTKEHVEIAELLRSKSEIVIAHGSCACIGGVVGLANLYKAREVLGRVFKKSENIDNPKGFLPSIDNGVSDEKSPALPLFLDQVKTLDQVIDVDYYIPGCPPTPELIKDALMAVLEGKLPAKGKVLALDKALCDSCARRDSKPDKVDITGYKRIYETKLDPDKCFLSQGIICLGPSTRGGCGERCIKANFPCRGCFGPTDKVMEQGAKSLSAIASIIDSDDEEKIKKAMASIPDPTGLFYRYSLASSIINKKINGL